MEDRIFAPDRSSDTSILLCEPADPPNTCAGGRNLAFAQAAVQRGYVGRQTLAEALGLLADGHREGRREEIGQILVRNRDLTASQFVHIQRSLGRGEAADPAAGDVSSVLSSIQGFGLLLGRIDGSQELDRIRSIHGERLEILEEIGRGGMATVYKARQRNLDRLVAVKVLALGSDDGFVERFRREARTAASLDHPSIVKTYECGESEGTHYIVQEYVEGESLAERIRRRGPLPSQEAAAMLLSIAEGIDHAHVRGVIHRDVKPANVLVDATGQTKVTDFGLACREGEIRLSATGAIVGTPAYMAPEQVDAAIGKVGPWTDVYGLGAVLYELLTGRPPLDAPRSDLLFQAILERAPSPPSAEQRAVDRALEAICMKCLEKAPRARYETARDLIHDLTAYVSGARVRARSAGITKRIGRRLRLRTLRSTVALLAVVAGLLAWQSFGPSRLEIEASDPRADVFVDGEWIGRGTVRTRLWFESSCRIEIRRAGYRPVDVEVELEPATRQSHRFELRPIAAPSVE